eukprot:365736-Chlamydomonas_euryale.AAC.16
MGGCGWAGQSNDRHAGDVDQGNGTHADRGLQMAREQGKGGKLRGDDENVKNEGVAGLPHDASPQMRGQ